MSNYSPYEKYPPSSESRTPGAILLGATAIAMVASIAVPIAVQYERNQPQPVTIAETIVPVLPEDIGNGRTLSKAVNLTVCKEVPKLITIAFQKDGQGDVEKIEATQLDNTCIDAARELMDRVDGAQNLIGKDVNVSLREYPNNGGVFIEAKAIG